MDLTEPFRRNSELITRHIVAVNSEIIAHTVRSEFVQLGADSATDVNDRIYFEKSKHQWDDHRRRFERPA